MPQIAVCEPVCADFRDLKDGQAVILNVTQGFLDKLRQRPAEYMDHQSNAFVFGRQRRLAGYEHAGDVFNDVGSVGIVLIEKNMPPIGQIHGKWLEFIKMKNNPAESLQEIYNHIMAEFPHILFIGQTNGGDVGASVYTHLDDDGDIDGLIIDNDYFFPDDSESGSEDDE